MRQREFGADGPQVSVIGQGTWYIDRGDRKARSPRCAAVSISA